MSETGIRIARKLLFEQDVHPKNDQWQRRMIDAIATAKRLGFRNFEIDVRGDQAEEVQEEAGFFVSLSSIWGVAPSQVENEEWKEDKQGEDKKKGARCLVRVWAIIAVNAKELEAA